MDGTVNHRIAYFRKLKGYTQQEMALLLDMKNSTYSTTERNENLSCKFLLDVADVLEVDPYYLLCGINHEETSVIVVKHKMWEVENYDLLDITSWERSHLAAINALAKSRKSALIKLTLLALNNKHLDIEGILKKAEELPGIFKPY